MLRGTCVHVISVGEADDLVRYTVDCPRPGEGVSLTTPAGRPPAVAGPYCLVHGGVQRAREEAERDWNHAAPASVGDAEAVMRAGVMGLRTEHAYVVIRQHDGVWLAFTGVGSHLTEVENPNARVQRTRNGRVRLAASKLRPRGACAFSDRTEALDAGVAAWRARVEARVDEIRRARGGTLDWGVPIDPLSTPIVIHAAPGECASDIAARAARVGTTGVSVFSGNRPTGEFA